MSYVWLIPCLLQVSSGGKDLHPPTQTHGQTHTCSLCFRGSERLWPHGKPQHIGERIKYGAKWSENYWGVGLSAIRIAPKWLLALWLLVMSLPPPVWQMRILSHQSEACVVMIYRLLLVKVLPSHNDKTKWDFIFLEQHVSIGTVCPGCMYQNCCLILLFTCVFYWKTMVISTYVLKSVTNVLFQWVLQIPVGMPLFKPWREVFVSLLFGSQKNLQMVCTHKGMGIIGFTCLLYNEVYIKVMAFSLYHSQR